MVEILLDLLPLLLEPSDMFTRSVPQINGDATHGSAVKCSVLFHLAFCLCFLLAKEQSYLQDLLIEVRKFLSPLAPREVRLLFQEPSEIGETANQRFTSYLASVPLTAPKCHSFILVTELAVNGWDNRDLSLSRDR